MNSEISGYSNEDFWKPAVVGSSSVRSIKQFSGLVDEYSNETLRLYGQHAAILTEDSLN